MITFPLEYLYKQKSQLITKINFHSSVDILCAVGVLVYLHIVVCIQIKDISIDV